MDDVPSAKHRTVRVGIVGDSRNATNRLLEREWRALDIDARVLTPAAAETVLRSGDVAIGRVDVRRTLDGLNPGALALLTLRRRGVRVLNGPAALLAAHDKLRTARLLAAAGLPHPRTEHLCADASPQRLALPLVLKPRFGSWGADVVRCETRAELERQWELLRNRRWFRRQGVLVQELVPPCGYDLRLVVAGGRIVAAIRRYARQGDWRTNISLGGRAAPTAVPPAAAELAVAAANALGIALAGVDVLLTGDRYTIIEVNGAVDFDDAAYSVCGRNIYAEAAAALALPASARLRRHVGSEVSILRG